MKKSSSIIITFLCFGLAAGAQEAIVLSLDECKSIALDNNNAVKNARLDIVAAKAKKSEIFTNYFPTVSAQGIAFHSLDHLIKIHITDLVGKSEMGYNIQEIYNNFAGQLGLSSSFDFVKYGQRYAATAIQPIFAGGRIVNGNLYAKLGIKAAGLKSSLTNRNVIEEVEKNYFMLAALLEKQKTLDALQTLIDSLDAVSSIALREGVILKADRMLLENKMTELQNGKLKLRTGIRLAKMNLLNCIGMEYSVIELDKYQFPSVTLDNIPKPEEVYKDEQQVVDNMEESKLLELQVEAKKFDKKLTLGSALPEVGLGFTYGYSIIQGLNEGRWNGTTFGVIKVPITDWAKKSYQMKQEQVAIDKAINDREHLGQMLLLQQRKFYLELTSAWDALQLAQSQKEYNEYLYDQAKVNYDAGFTTMTDVLQAYSNLVQVQENWCNSLSDYLAALQVYRGRIAVNQELK